MIIKDIVNRDIINLENCEHEPIHIPGSIQPHGFLLAIELAENRIRFCSENVLVFTGQPAAGILSVLFDTLLNDAGKKAFYDHLASGADLGLTPLRLEIAGKDFDTIMHYSGPLLVIECEPPAPGITDVNSVYSQTQRFVSYMENAASLQQLCQHVADETRELTGYDRVMIYRFDKDYNGEVFAESRKEELESFLGLHYPHTDIPVQARELYMRNLLRLIPDIDYTPVPVLTAEAQQQEVFDMSLATLRSVSPIHVQYLQNMGVGATLTISLIHKGRLWGLVACHHYGPHYLPHHKKISARLQGHFLASQISIREETEEYGSAGEIHQQLDVLLDRTYELNWDSLKDLVSQQELLDIVLAKGVALFINGELYTHGRVPGGDEIKKLANWLSTYVPEGEFYTEKLSNVYKEAEKLPDTAAGILYHSLTDAHIDCIIWFRPESLSEVNWAGNPEKAIIKDEKGLFPRKSFELWKQVIKNESNTWKKPELNAATNFVHALQKHIHLLFLSEEELKYRQLSIKLQEANAELENINWISTHDLKEPLRKIQIFASRMLETQESDIPGHIAGGIQKMRDAAQRMQTLLADIVAYSKLLKIKDAFEEVDLNQQVSRVIEELKDETQEIGGTIHYQQLPTIKGIPFLISQLFVNLVQNALKFSKKGVPPVITIEGEPHPVPGPTEAYHQKLYHKISLHDNGIGFENLFSEDIFHVFVRLHGKDEYSGSGVGLALCKKIMQNHEGFIMATGEPGEGATFTMYFPIK